MSTSQCPVGIPLHPPRFSSARGMGVTMDQRRRLMMASKCLDIRLGRLARVDLDPDVAEQQETQPFPPLAPMETLEVSLLEIRCPRLGLGPLGQLSMQSEDRLLLKVQNALSAWKTFQILNGQWLQNQTQVTLAFATTVTADCEFYPQFESNGNIWQTTVFLWNIECTLNKRSQCSDDLSFCLSRKVARLGTVGTVGTVARQRATSISFGTGQCIGGLCSWRPHGVGAWIRQWKAFRWLKASISSYFQKVSFLFLKMWLKIEDSIKHCEINNAIKHSTPLPTHPRQASHPSFLLR